MKAFKKFGALILAALLVLAMAAPAMAAGATGGEHTLTVRADGTNGSPLLTDHTMNAYQIFYGDTTPQTSGANMSVTGWGDGIDGNALIEAIEDGTYNRASDNTAMTISDGLKNRFTGTASATDFAYRMGAFTDNSGATPVDYPALTAAETAELAKIMRAFIDTTKAVPLVENTSTPGLYEAKNLKDGYYLVVDDTDPLKDENDSASANLLQLVEDTTVNIKAAIPQSDKGVSKVAPSTNTGRENYPAAGLPNDVQHANIGDTVYYELVGTTSTEMSKFDTYYYAFKDNLSKGLTYNNDVKVYRHEDDVTDLFDITCEGVYAEVTTPDVANIGSYYERTGTDPDFTYAKTTDTAINSAKTYYEKTGGSFLKIEAKGDDLKTAHGKDNTKAINGGDTLTVHYSATLNQDAVIGGEGNTNDMNIEYSNDPDTNDHGESTPDKTTVFTVKLDITKEDDAGNKLPGAIFTLYRMHGNNRQYVIANPTGEEYDAVATPVATNLNSYYEKTGDTYTLTTDTTIDPAKTYYTKDIVYTVSGWSADVENTGTTSNPIWATPATATQFSTGTDGGVYQGIVIKGLEGEATTGHTYYLHEEKAPAGYNKLADDQEWIIKCVGTETENTFSITELSVTNGTADAANGKVSETVINTNDLVLPTTGGIGTTIFYTVGALLVVGAGILLVTRRRVAVK